MTRSARFLLRTPNHDSNSRDGDREFECSLLPTVKLQNFSLVQASVICNLKTNNEPVKSCGNLIGRMTASFSASFAPSKPAISSQLTFGFSITIAPDNRSCNFLFSESFSESESDPFETEPPSFTAFRRSPPDYQSAVSYRVNYPLPWFL